MFHKIDIENWNRKQTFDYFKEFEQPFFNVTVNTDITQLYDFCKSKEHSFFLASLYYSTKAANQIANFKYRIQDNEVICYDKINAGSTILFKDNSFGFCYFDFINDLESFINTGQQNIEQALKNPSFAPKDNKDNLIHYSVLPWLAFSSVQHARRIPTTDSIPKIAMGKIFEEGRKKIMPISIEVHHSLVDGWHVGQYFQLLEASISEL